MQENELDVRDEENLLLAYQEADRIIMKKYMSDIVEYDVVPISAELKETDLSNMIRIDKVDKIVYDAEENNQDKLMNVYNAVAMSGGSVINVIHSDGKSIEYYLGTKMRDINRIAVCHSSLSGTFEGNFPGSTISNQKKGAIEKCVESIFSSEYRESTPVISVVSGIPSIRRAEKSEDKKNFSQGIEKVLDSMKGKKFTLITISDPVSRNELLNIKEGYERLYSELSPFASSNFSYSESDSNAVAKTITDNFTKTVGDSISNTISNSTSSSRGINESSTTSTSVSYGFSSGLFPGPNGSVSGSHSKTVGTSSSVTKGISNSTGNTTSTSESTGQSVGNTDTFTNTNGRTLQITIENKQVKDLLKRIDKQIERLEDASDLGLWNTASYCIADDSQTSRLLANSIEAVCRGDKSSIESFAIGTWDDKRNSRRVVDYLKKFSHPIIDLDGYVDNLEVNPTSLINGKELVIEAGLPQKSVSGVPVTEMVSFARNVVSDVDGDRETIHLGHVYHMGQPESACIDLDKESMSAHTLVTGSTGSGKSNTVYQILNEMLNKKVNFLVVEPAKGEYKGVFGNRKDVSVYGTNEKITELLRINPFAFPDSIHVLEHIDRLIEIFNVCWPMYAAMPAVLKEAVLQSYQDCGWDLENSENQYGNDVFPNFKDLMNHLKTVIQNSEYSEEVKGNYIGSLVTRVKSLTNGINGRLFTENSISDEDLFDKNVIVDLSRVGSSETKSLIMGMLVMKLNEYRMDQAMKLKVMNQSLKHITVLEEAHNLLKNASGSSSAPSEEGGNMAGKSVEMISNSIAEMRTYGEGFIIVDQSPSAIDISAIRNTNTKIIMRLPEDSDRKQAGKASALKDKQIDELAKLGRGIAVVYQNNWLDPVLCKIEKADVSEEMYQYEKNEVNKKSDLLPLFGFLMSHRMDEKVDYNLDDVERIVSEVNTSMHTKIQIRRAIENEREGLTDELFNEDSFSALSDVMVDIVGCEDRLNSFTRFAENADLLQQELNREVERCAGRASEDLKLAVSHCIVREMYKTNENIEMYSGWRNNAVGIEGGAR